MAMSLWHKTDCEKCGMTFYASRACNPVDTEKNYTCASCKDADRFYKEGYTNGYNAAKLEMDEEYKKLLEIKKIIDEKLNQ